MRTTRPLKVRAPINASPLVIQRPKQRDYSRSASRRCGCQGGSPAVPRATSGAHHSGGAALRLETDYEIRGRRSLPQLKSQLKHVRAFFAIDRALAVTTDRVRSYILNRQKEGAAPATVNREVVALQAAFSLAVESEPQKLSHAPRFLTLPEDNTRQGFFERADLEAVARLLPEDLQDFARFGYLTGWRSGEIKSLAWSEFDLETRQLRLRGANSKNGEPRKLTLTDELWEIVERRWKARVTRDRTARRYFLHWFSIA